MRTPAALLTLALALCDPSSAALAQARGGAANAPPPAQATRDPPPPRPDRTTASYGDWTLRCEHPPAEADRTYDVAQTVNDQRGQALAHLSVRRMATGGLLLLVQVGTNATVHEALRLGVEDQTSLSLPFQRCFPRGCFAEAQPSDAELNALGQRGDVAKITYHDGEGQVVSINVPLRGFGSSLDALRSTWQR